MILTDITQFRCQRNRLNQDNTRFYKGIKINISNKKIILKCDGCNTVFKGNLCNYFDKGEHYCLSCKNKRRLHYWGDKISKGKIGKKVPKISEAKKGHINSEETRLKISLANFGRSAWNKGLSMSDERVKKGIEILLEKRVFKCYSKVSQKLFWKIYKVIKDKFKYIYFAELNREYTVGRKYIDFYIKDINAGIEFIGEYWHKNKRYQDLKRYYYLLENNPNIKLFYISDLELDRFNKCLNFINKIKETYEKLCA